MALPVTIEDGPVEVRDRALVVTQVHTTHTREQAQRVRVFTSRLADSAGSVDMAIDGSGAPVNFDIDAEQDDLIIVSSVRFVFHSTNMKIDGNESRRFGPVAAPGLTNGLVFRAIQNGTTSEIFLDPVKVLGDFYRYSGGDIVGANTAFVNDVDGISAGVDFFMITVVLPHPVSLYPGTEDRLRVVVQDDLSGIALFEVQTYGTREKAA